MTIALHGYRIGPDFVIAQDEADARHVLLETYGEEVSADETPEPLDEARVLTEVDDDTRESHTVAQWIAKRGRGHLFSLEH